MRKGRKSTQKELACREVKRGIETRVYYFGFCSRDKWDSQYMCLQTNYFIDENKYSRK